MFILGRLLPICHCLQYQSNTKVFISRSRNKGNLNINYHITISVLRFYPKKFDCIFFYFQNYSDIDLLYHQFYTGLDRNLTSDEQKIIMSLATSEVSITPINIYKNFSCNTQFVYTVKYMQHFYEVFLCSLFGYTHEWPSICKQKENFQNTKLLFSHIVQPSYWYSIR